MSQKSAGLRFRAHVSTRHILAGLFLTAQLPIIALYIPDPLGRITLFWYCNHIFLLLAFGFLSNNAQMIKGFINVGFIPQALWTLDFIVAAITGYYIFGVTDYVFDATSALSVIWVVLIHVGSIFVALIATYQVKPRPISVFYSIMYIGILYVLTLVFTPVSENVNCVIEACVYPHAFNASIYTFLWPFLVTIIIVLPTYGIQRLMYYWHEAWS